MLSLVEVITGAEPSKLISTLYLALRARSVADIVNTAKNRWEGDIGPVEDEDWDEVLENVKKTSPRLPERMTQLYIIHKSYLTPARLAKFSQNQDTHCPRCMSPISSFFHLIWSCPAIQTYWNQIITFLHDDMGSPVQVEPRVCILGLLPDVTIDKFTATFIYESLFCARKLVAKHWMRASPPTFRDWIKMVNLSLPYKKVIYKHRGCPAKYNRIWDKWIDNTNTCEA